MMTFNAAFPVQNHPFPHEMGMKMVCCDLKAFMIKKIKSSSSFTMGETRPFRVLQK